MFKKLLLKVLAHKSEEYIHTKTGNKYRLLFLSNLFSARSGFPVTAVYMCESGTIYSRPLSVFREKFKHSKSPKVFPI